MLRVLVLLGLSESMSRQVVRCLCVWALCFLGSPAFADEPNGILPLAVRPAATQAEQAPASWPKGKNQNDATAGDADVSAAGGRGTWSSTYSPILAMYDLMQARRSSPDGLLWLHYQNYLTHALLLSSVEVKAHDLQRMPLHRFTSPLDPGQIAEIPLASVGGPRAFHMLILYTFVEGNTDSVAEQLSTQCTDCAGALAAFVKASNAYKASEPSTDSDDALPVFFAVVNVGTRDGAAISAVHPAMQLPVVVHLPPTADRASVCETSGQGLDGAGAKNAAECRRAGSSLKAARYRMTASDFFSRALGNEEDEEKKLQKLLLVHLKNGIHGKVHFISVPQGNILLLQRRKNEASLEQRLLQWANTRTNRSITYAGIDHSPQAQVRNGWLSLVTLLLIMVCWLMWKAVSCLRRNQWIIPAGGVVVYTLCSSGLVFSVIHSVPFSGYDEVNRRYVLLAPTSRAQYLLEGLLLSCCSTVASVAALGLVQTRYFARLSAYRATICSHPDTHTAVRRNGTDLGGPEGEAGWRRYFAVASFAVLAAVLVFCAGLVMKCYRAKAAWYAPTFWPGPHLPTGPIKNDWGNMF